MEEKKQRNKFYSDLGKRNRNRIVSDSGCLFFRLCHDLWRSDAPGLQLGRADKQLLQRKELSGDPGLWTTDGFTGK